MVIVDPAAALSATPNATERERDEQEESTLVRA
jgi:hypothetical protein